MNVEAWRDQAACAGQPRDWWFVGLHREGGYSAEEWATHRRALFICKHCPVQNDCLDYALEYKIEWGIWGGKTQQERIKMRRRVHG